MAHPGGCAVPHKPKPGRSRSPAQVPGKANPIHRQACRLAEAMPLERGRYGGHRPGARRVRPARPGLRADRLDDRRVQPGLVLAHQPHFANQPPGVQVLGGHGQFPNRIGNVVAKAMTGRTGADLLQALCGHSTSDAARQIAARAVRDPGQGDDTAGAGLGCNRGHGATGGAPLNQQPGVPPRPGCAWPATTCAPRSGRRRCGRRAARGTPARRCCRR